MTSDWPENCSRELPDELHTCCFHFRGWEESPAPPRSVRGAQVHSLSEVTGRGQEVFCHVPLNPSGVQHHTWKKADILNHLQGDLPPPRSCSLNNLAFGAPGQEAAVGSWLLQ